MAFGQKGPCVTCEYLDRSDTWNGEVYCKYLKSYIKPDFEGCVNHRDNDD